MKGRELTGRAQGSFQVKGKGETSQLDFRTNKNLESRKHNRREAPRPVDESMLAQWWLTSCDFPLDLNSGTISGTVPTHCLDGGQDPVTDDCPHPPAQEEERMRHTGIVPSSQGGNRTGTQNTDAQVNSQAPPKSQTGASHTHQSSCSGCI